MGFGELEWNDTGHYAETALFRYHDGKNSTRGWFRGLSGYRPLPHSPCRRNSSWPGLLTVVLFVRLLTAGSLLVALTKSHCTTPVIARAMKLSWSGSHRWPPQILFVFWILSGGQYALLAKKLWNDHTTVADVTQDHLNHVREQGVETIRWDLSREEPPFSESFDAIIFSEVIEHLPCAGYIALERCRAIACAQGGF